MFLLYVERLINYTRKKKIWIGTTILAVATAVCINCLSDDKIENNLLLSNVEALAENEPEMEEEHVITLMPFLLMLLIYYRVLLVKKNMVMVFRQQLAQMNKKRFRLFINPLSR